jgi:UDP-glucose 4-epimerase
VPQVVCDLAAPDAPARLSEAMDGVGAVVHLAGENEVLAAREPAAALASTVVATERVAEACVTGAVGRLVYLSTMHVYGARVVPGAELTEDLRPEPRSAYAISRLASEHVAAALCPELAVLRLTNSVGAPDDPRVDRWSLLVNDLCRQGATEGALRLRTSGTQWRDFVPLPAVCRAIVAACDPAAIPPGTYNIGSGHVRRVREVAELIAVEFEHQTGRRPPLDAPDPEPDPPGPYRVRVDRARSHGLELGDPLDEALAETVRFCLEHREELVP